MNNRLDATLKIGVGAAGGLSTLSGLVSDFFIPIAPFGFYIGLLLLGFLIFAVTLRLIPSTHRYFEKNLAIYWFMPVLMAISVGTVVSFTIYGLSKDSGPNGFLAKSSEEIADLQSSLLLGELKQANETLFKIEKNTSNGKREVSQNPRKELNNMGLAWSHEDFYEAIIRGDSESVKLYLDGGMTLPRGLGMIGIESILPDIIARTAEDSIKTIDLIIDHYELDIDAQYNIEAYADMRLLDFKDKVIEPYITMWYKNTELSSTTNMTKEKEFIALQEKYDDEYLNSYLKYVQKLTTFSEKFVDAYQPKDDRSCYHADKRVQTQLPRISSVKDIYSLQVFFNETGIDWVQPAMTEMYLKMAAHCTAFKVAGNSVPSEPKYKKLDKQTYLNDTTDTLTIESWYMPLNLIATLFKKEQWFIEKFTGKSGKSFMVYLSNGVGVKVEMGDDMKLSNPRI